MRHAACSGIWLRLRRVDPLQATATGKVLAGGCSACGARAVLADPKHQSGILHCILNITFFCFLRETQKQKQKQKQKGEGSEKGQCDPPPGWGAAAKAKSKAQGTRQTSQLVT
jgi:hypothetical protein